MPADDTLYARRYTQVNGERRQTNASDGSLISKGLAGKEAAEERRKVDWERVMAKYTRRLFLDDKYKISVSVASAAKTSHSGTATGGNDEDSYFEQYEGIPTSSNSAPGSSNLLVRNVNGTTSIPPVIVLDQSTCIANLTKLLAEHRQLHTASFLASHQNKRKQLVVKIVDALRKRGAVVPVTDLAPEGQSSTIDTSDQCVPLVPADDENLDVAPTSKLGQKRQREEQEQLAAISRGAHKDQSGVNAAEGGANSSTASTLADDLAIVFGGKGYQPNAAGLGHISAEAARFLGANENKISSSTTSAGKPLTASDPRAPTRMVPRAVLAKQQMQVAAAKSAAPVATVPVVATSTAASSHPHTQGNLSEQVAKATPTGDAELDDFLADL